MDHPTNDSVLFERLGSIAIATLNRREVMNAINGALRRSLA
jgi:enoyl-CoA hydratase/carnithine racemase